MEDSREPTMPLEDFLRDRGVPEKDIRYFQQEKIDSSSILLMSDDELRNILPKYGDRLAVRDYCKKKQCSRKQSLIEKLRTKLDLKKNRPSTTDTNERRTTSKPTRIIEIGWMCMSKKENAYKHVRTKAGGGTRRLPFNKLSTCDHILEKAMELFFPNGVSAKGPVEKFDFELLDYKRHKFDTSFTVEKMYELSALTTLRFYMATTFKSTADGSDDDVEDYIPSTLVSTDMETTTASSVDYNENNESITNLLYLPTTEQFGLQISHSFPLSLPYIEHTPHNTSVHHSSPQISASSSVQHFSDQINNTMDNSFTTPEGTNHEETLLTVHRGKIFEELLQAFQQDFFDINRVKIEMILPNGEVEFAEDMGGVFRDALSEFWETFFEKCTVGTVLKIPYIRDDFKEEQWKAIGKILMKGYDNEKHFPIKLAPIFIKKCFDHDIVDEEVTENFMQFVSDSEADLLREGLKDFSIVDKDELVEFFSNYDSKRLPTQENFSILLRDVAYKEMIQKPAFVIKCFQEVFRHSVSLTVDQLDKIYENLKPTAKNCLKKIELKTEALSPEERTVFAYLKKYLKEIDDRTRALFFRFCTGSDLPIRNVEVTFTSSAGIGRTPVAHTCSGLLELPSTYENFVTFRSEINGILHSNVWVMDIV